MTDKNKLFEPMYLDLIDDNSFPKKQPLLAHYTSIECLESIIKTEEVWFSNPLLMNDLAELRHGLFTGRRLFWDNEEIAKVCNNPDRVRILENFFDHYFEEFEKNVAFDIYAFCFSEHKPDNKDGLLSMWRGYGENGKGTAIVFNTENLEDLEDSPLVISRVNYLSYEEMEQLIKNKISEFSKILSNLLLEADYTDNDLHIAAYHFFERLKLFALFTKHRGFSEEEEWRVVYLPDRDHTGALKSRLDYSVGKKGVEPRLKLKLEHIDGITQSNLSLDNIVSEIILGPGISSELAKKSIIRMLEKNGKTSLAKKVIASTIPFRVI